jgi:UDPglucose 6-dehydrogenase
MKVGFVGASHLGQVYAVASAAAGMDVVILDPDAGLIARLEVGPTVAEPELDEMWNATNRRRQLSADLRLACDCDLVFISQDVPTNEHGASDTNAVDSLARELFAVLAGSGVPVVLLSQVTPGTTRRLSTVYSPLSYQVETLVFGQALSRARQPERHIVGLPNSNDLLHLRHAEWLEAFPTEKYLMNYESAELAKVAINLYLAASVSTTNALAELARSVGARWDDIVPALRSDRRIGPYAYLNPGLGLSGGNIERDLATFLRLAQQGGADDSVVAAFIQSNGYHRDWALRTLAAQRLPSGGTVAVLGLAYKPDTASTKNSPALDILGRLEGTNVRVHDPRAVLASHQGWAQQSRSWRTAVQGADCLLVMTPWAEYRSIDLREAVGLMRRRLVIDPHGVFRQSATSIPDLEYHSLYVGKP